jgi:hypothetical protein
MGIQTKRRARQILLCFLLGGAAAPALAAKISCVPGAASSGAGAPFNAVRKISIDEHSRTVNMDVVRARTKDTETMGKMRGDLLSMDETQSGEPVYVFNAIPAAGAEALSLFRLFKTSEWRLIGAVVSFTQKVPALRSVEPAVVFDCKRSGMG